MAVIGGGPAGATAAIRLASGGHSVVLFDCRKPDKFQGGETLPPEVTPELRSLGVYNDFLALQPIACPGVVSAWGSAVVQETDYIRNPYGPGWHICRERFDAMLLRAAGAAGTHVLRDCAVSRCAREPDGTWRLMAGDNGIAVGCRMVVDASGSNGFGGACPHRREHDDVLLALVFEFAAAEPVADPRTYIESAPRGWWYSAPVPRGVLVAMFFTDRQTYTVDGISIGAQLDACALTERRIGSRQLVAQRIVHARSALNPEPARDGWIAAGDSASCYDPIAGAGVWKALRNGMAAAKVAAGYLCGSAAALPEYATRIESDFTAYTQRRAGYYNSETRWQAEHFWRRWH